MSRLLPLFPLQLVVFPRTQLPLHIFEERYREMVGAAIRGDSEFGIVLAKDGGIVNAGCTVSVVKVVTEYPDGRLDIVTVGRRRFEIIYLNQERSFLQAEVEFFDDELPVSIPPELTERVTRGYREMTEAADSPPQADPDMNDAQLSFQLAQSIPDLDIQGQLLRSRSELERLQSLAGFFQQQIPRVRAARRMRRLAPTNGFGHTIAGV